MIHRLFTLFNFYKFVFPDWFTINSKQEANPFPDLFYLVDSDGPFMIDNDGDSLIEDNS